MPMNPLPPTGAMGAPPTAPAGPGHKEEAATPDSAFTALLMALLGAPGIAPAPAPEQVPAAQSGEGAQAPAPIQAPAEAVATPAGAVLPEVIETILQAQRVVAAPEIKADAQPLPAADVAPVVGTTPPAAPAPEGEWVVEPLAVTDVAVPAAETGISGGPAQQEEKPGREERKAPAPAPAPTPGAPEVPAFAPVDVAAVHRPEAKGPAAVPNAPQAIPSPIEPDRLMDAIAKSAISAGDGKYTVTLRLHPEQLGEVRLQLHVAGREVQTSLQVANSTAQQFLEQRSDQLREGLSQSGLTLSGFHVATGQQGRQRQTEQPFEQTGPRRRSRQAAGAAPVGGVAARPVRLLTTRPTVGLDTLA
ncbi:MAG TPA: flagellar hook-length control protein FliK [Symbiobacteriaceae bacterium]|nr:flagellar hook-length control protein FliK [Symbiobacteriaceae bacterium]